MILFNGVKVPIGMFPNQEVNISRPFFEEHYKEDSNEVTFKYEDDSDLIRLLFVRQAITFPCELNILYLPYSRMDRESKEYLFTLRSITDFINWMQWDKVTVFEPHSDVTPALLDRCKVIPLAPLLMRKIKGPYQIFYPDAGAQKRYNFAVPIPLVGLKERDFLTGRITKYQVVGTREYPSVVIVDDLCSKGGTFILAAKQLREMGFTNIQLVVGHCEETIFKGDIFKTDLIDHVYTTDSIIAGSDGVSKFTVIPMQTILHGA